MAEGAFYIRIGLLSQETVSLCLIVDLLIVIFVVAMHI